MSNKTEQLFFIQDKTCGSRNQVYSGHTGKNKTFRMYQSDYGKHAMQPLTLSECSSLMNKIEKDAPKNMVFDWDIIPITKIELCNFWKDEDFDAFEELKRVQLSLYGENNVKTVK